MNNIEEDFRLFQLVRRKPIKNCIDLTKGLRGKRSGIFYFTEDFRIDFENKMCDLERLKTEREQDKARIKEILNRLHINDIEPWSFYKVSGDILFDLRELLEDK